MRKRLVAVACDGVSLFELGMVVELFGIDRSELTSDWYEFELCSTGGGRVRTDTGLAVEVPPGLDRVDGADIVIVLPTIVREPPPGLSDALCDAHRRGAKVVALCTGAFLLAAAGLLDQRRATTHWATSDELADRFPSVEVDAGVLYIDEGDVATSAGAAAGIDLCLHVVRTDLGAEVANMVARELVVPPHRDGGQAQFIPSPAVAPAGEEIGLDDALEWGRRHLGEPITVEDLAARAAMSPRTFARRFGAATGTTPHRWLVVERLQLAQRLLETTEHSVERVAEEAGFGTGTNMRLHFQRAFSVSPGRYRAAFRASDTA